MRSTTSVVYRWYTLAFNEAFFTIRMLVNSKEFVYSGCRSGLPVRMLKLLVMLKKGLRSHSSGLQILRE